MGSHAAMVPVLREIGTKDCRNGKNHVLNRVGPPDGASTTYGSSQPMWPPDDRTRPPAGNDEDRLG